MRGLDDLAEAVLKRRTPRIRGRRKTMLSPCRVGLHRWATVVYRGTTYGRCMECKQWDELLTAPPKELVDVMEHQIEVEQ